MKSPLQGASLLAAVGHEIASMLRHTRHAAADAADAAEQQIAHAAQRAEQQSGRRWARHESVQQVDAAPPLPSRQQGLGSYALERAGLWGVMLALLCGLLLSWLRRPRSAQDDAVCADV